MPVFLFLNKHLSLNSRRTYPMTALPLSELQNLNPIVQDRETVIALPLPFEFVHGSLTVPVSVKVRRVGPENAPIVVVLGGISADRHACDRETVRGTVTPGWWRDVVGPGKVIDTERYQVLSFDFLPNANPNPAIYTITPADQAKILDTVLNELKIDRLHAFVGASYGGMIGLNFAKLYPQRLGHLVMVCAAHRPHPLGSAWRSIQRKIVHFGLETNQPQRGLSLARELGMTTYRTAREFGERFADTAEVDQYLESRGRQFITKMSPERYLTLSQSIDLHSVDPTEVQVPTTVIGFTEDQLVPIEDIRVLSQQLPILASYAECESIFGHDAFLKEIDFLNDTLKPVLP